jgi:uncharacterized repeat protein (TIGR04076 family)
MDMGKVKITVLKRTKHLNLVEEYGNREMIESPCEVFKDGEEFVIEGTRKPDGFCDWAWHDIWSVIIALSYGANFPWHTKPGTAIACCTDGMRPVIFKLERIED